MRSHVRWLAFVVAVSGCTYYTVAPDEARRIAAMSREEREASSVDAMRDDDKLVRVKPSDLRLVEPWHEGKPMHLRRPPHPALTTGAVIAIVGLVLVIPGALVMALGSSTTSAGNCDICAFTSGYGTKMVGGALLGVGLAEVVIGGVTFVIGATRSSPDDAAAK
jgi:hypothetical protein